MPAWRPARWRTGEDGSRPLPDASRAARGVIETSEDVVVVGGGTAGTNCGDPSRATSTLLVRGAASCRRDDDGQQSLAFPACFMPGAGR